MLRPVSLFMVALFMAGCAQLPWPGKVETDHADGADGVAPTATPQDIDVAPVPDDARTVEQFDTTTQEQRQEAATVATSENGQDLGATITSLGSPSEPGFWLKTPLVDAPGKGRVVYPETGKAVQVDLVPLDGPKTAGSRMSLAAMRLVGAPLTGLPEMRVYRTGS